MECRVFENIHISVDSESNEDQPAGAVEPTEPICGDMPTTTTQKLDTTACENKLAHPPHLPHSATNTGDTAKPHLQCSCRERETEIKLYKTEITELEHDYKQLLISNMKHNPPAGSPTSTTNSAVKPITKNKSVPAMERQQKSKASQTGANKYREAVSQKIGRAHV